MSEWKETTISEIVTLIGPNGSGKSTTAKMALGVLKADEGKVYRRSELRSSYVPQRLDVNWTLPLSVHRFMELTNRATNSEIDLALSSTEISHLARKQMSQLSGGEFQRALLARAILRTPDLLVLDEPVQGVDYNGEIALYKLIDNIRNRLNCGVLLISHDLHVVMSTTDKVLCLNGHVCCSGSPMDVARNNEYKTLFGEQASQILSVYEHKHDHVHSDEGEIKKN